MKDKGDDGNDGDNENDDDGGSDDASTLPRNVDLFLGIDSYATINVVEKICSHTM